MMMASYTPCLGSGGIRFDMVQCILLYRVRHMTFLQVWLNCLFGTMHFTGNNSINVSRYASKTIT